MTKERGRCVLVAVKYPMCPDSMYELPEDVYEQICYDERKRIADRMRMKALDSTLRPSMWEDAAEFVERGGEE